MTILVRAATHRTFAAPAAHADPEHYWAYMNCLKQGGVAFYNPNDAITLGFKIYRELRTTAPDAIYRELEDQAGMSQSQATSAVSWSQANGHFPWPGLG
jgi:hypothetical protein